MKNSAQANNAIPRSIHPSIAPVHSIDTERERERIVRGNESRSLTVESRRGDKDVKGLRANGRVKGEDGGEKRG